MRRAGAALLLVVLLVLAGTWAGIAAETGFKTTNESDLSLGGIDFPDSLGGFKRGRARAATRSSALQGPNVEYASPAATARVFVYGGGVPEDADANSAQVRRELKAALAVEAGNARRRGGGDFSVGGVRKVRAADLKEHFLEAEMRLDDGRTVRTAYLYLGSFQGRFVKVTVSADSRRSGLRSARSFIQALTNHLWLPGEAGKSRE